MDGAVVAMAGARDEERAHILYRLIQIWAADPFATDPLGVISRLWLKGENPTHVARALDEMRSEGLVEQRNVAGTVFFHALDAERIRKMIECDAAA